MKRNLFKISFLFVICILFVCLIMIFINSKRFYYDAIDNIMLNYNNIIKIKDLFNDDNFYYSGNIKTEHTSNLVHSINQVYEKNYDFILEKKKDNLYVYLDDFVSMVSIDSFNDLFNINKIDSCIYIDKENDGKYNKYNYMCDMYSLSIYTSKFFNRYIKSNITFNDVIIDVNGNNVNFDNGILKLRFSNIKDDNYVMNFNYNDIEFDLFYTYNNYDKYSFLYNSSRVSLVIDEDIVLLINCDTRRYSKLELTLTKKDISLKDKYNDISFDELVSLVISSDIYSLFK